MAPSRIAKNSFFNFIRSYSVRHTDWPAPKIAVEGAKLWQAMCEKDRRKFVNEASILKNTKHKSILKKKSRYGKSVCNTTRRRGRSGSRGRCGQKRKSRSKGSCGGRRRRRR